MSGLEETLRERMHELEQRESEIEEREAKIEADVDIREERVERRAERRRARGEAPGQGEGARRLRRPGAGRAEEARGRVVAAPDRRGGAVAPAWPFRSTGVGSAHARRKGCSGARASAPGAGRSPRSRGSPRGRRPTRTRRGSAPDRAAASRRRRPDRPAGRLGHDVLWWLDRMVRTRRPLVERMTLVWHDWFATSNAGVGSQKLMLRQNGLFRRQGLGNFMDLLRGVTEDPAMILWLSSADNTMGAERELRARAHGALHTRRQPWLHEQGRARAGPRPHRLSVRLDRTPGQSSFASTPSGTTRA